MTVLVAVVIAVTAFNGGRIAQRWIATEHERISSEESNA